MQPHKGEGLDEVSCSRVPRMVDAGMVHAVHLPSAIRDHMTSATRQGQIGLQSMLDKWIMVQRNG